MCSPPFKRLSIVRFCSPHCGSRLTSCHYLHKEREELQTLMDADADEDEDDDELIGERSLNDNGAS